MKKNLRKTLSSALTVLMTLMRLSGYFVAGATSSSKGISVEKNNGRWAAVKNGKVATSYTGVAKNQNGWWRIKNGYVDFSYTGIANNENGWWRIENGKVNFKATGVYKNENGWWRVENGKVDFKATGVYKNENGWWRVENGKVNFNANGVFKNENGWWRVSKGKVDFNFTGIAGNAYGNWYCKNGKVDFNKNGTVSYNGKKYIVENGKASIYNPAPEKFDANVVKTQLQTKAYSYKSTYGDYGYCVLKIKNGSQYTIDISTDITFFASGNMVDTASDSEYDVPAGHEIILYGMSDSAFDQVTYSLTVEETEYYKPVAQNLIITDQTISGDKVVFTVKNTGSDTVEFPKVTALFFKNGALVDTDYTYTSTGNNVQLVSGQSVNKDLSTYGKEFDTVELYASGRSAFISRY